MLVGVLPDNPFVRGDLQEQDFATSIADEHVSNGQDLNASKPRGAQFRTSACPHNW